jgi:hypothetical protein
VDQDKIVPLGSAPEPRVIDFRHFDYETTPMALPATIVNGKARTTSRKQLRHRLRRAQSRGANGAAPNEREMRQLYKPISEWDAEELARGRPRDRDGGFRGLAPKWISRELHEEAVTRFRSALRDEMNSSSVRAVEIINLILNDEEIDAKGRPTTPQSTKLDAAKFLVEHVLGKPKQRVETDISVKLQGVLASAIITPGTLPAQLGSGELASPRSRADLGIIDVDADDDDE